LKNSIMVKKKKTGNGGGKRNTGGPLSREWRPITVGEFVREGSPGERTPWNIN